MPRAKPPSELLVTAIPFTVAHGLFLLLVFLIVTRIAPDPDQLRRAAVALLALQGIAFGIDLWTLANWPAARVNERADHLLGRVVLVHLSIIVGMFLFAWLERPGAFFGFFVGCKVLADLSAFLPSARPGHAGAATALAGGDHASLPPPERRDVRGVLDPHAQAGRQSGRRSARVPGAAACRRRPRASGVRRQGSHPASRSPWA